MKMVKTGSHQPNSKTGLSAEKKDPSTEKREIFYAYVCMYIHVHIQMLTSQTTVMVLVVNSTCC